MRKVKRTKEQEKREEVGREREARGYEREREKARGYKREESGMIAVERNEKEDAEERRERMSKMGNERFPEMESVEEIWKRRNIRKTKMREEMRERDRVILHGSVRGKFSERKDDQKREI